jgi:hypothetical protein
MNVLMRLQKPLGVITSTLAIVGVGLSGCHFHDVRENGSSFIGKWLHVGDYVGEIRRQIFTKQHVLLISLAHCYPFSKDFSR